MDVTREHDGIRDPALGEAIDQPRPGSRVAVPAVGPVAHVLLVALVEMRHQSLLAEWARGCPQNFKSRELLVAAEHARIVRELRASGRRAVVLSGGELTVTIRGKGRGGPNQEYALALAMALDGMPAVAAIAADTDGTDGGAGSPLDPAGALVDGGSVARAKTNGLDPAAFLTDNNSSAFFEALGDLLAAGPTFTNVNDFRAIIVDRP